MKNSLFTIVMLEPLDDSGRDQPASCVLLRLIDVAIFTGGNGSRADELFGMPAQGFNRLTVETAKQLIRAGEQNAYTW